jgi:hypothetical protein
MKKFFLFPVTMIALLTGCNNDVIYCSDDTVTLTSSKSDFTRVSVDNACMATVTAGDTWSVVVEISEDAEEYLTIVSSGSEIRFSLDDQYSYRNLRFRVSVIMPELSGVSGSGASDYTIEGFSSDVPCIIDLSGASTLIGNLDCGNMSIFLSGASKVALEGSCAGNVLCEASGASIINLRDFPCVDSRIELSGASIMRVAPSGKLSGALSGASILYYYGDPDISSIDISGASLLEKID